MNAEARGARCRFVGKWDDGNGVWGAQRHMLLVRSASMKQPIVRCLLASLFVGLAVLSQSVSSWYCVARGRSGCRGLRRFVPRGGDGGGGGGASPPIVRSRKRGGASGLGDATIRIGIA